MNVRAAQMEQLDETARSLFGPVVADVGVAANCGGDTGEHYKHAQAFIRMREGVTVRDVRDILIGAGWDTDPPGGGATFRVGFPLAHERAAADHLHIETQPLPRLRDGG